MEQSGSYCDYLRAESARFREVLAATPGDAVVPSCPGWSAEDLVWHVASGQWFWGTVLLRGLATREQVDALEHPERPGTGEGLWTFFEQATETMQHGCQLQAGVETRWMWTQDPQLHTAYYIRRRQAQEALMHRIDAELTASVPVAPIDVDLAADGVDEVLTVMYAAVPSGRAFTPADGHLVQVRTSDTDEWWLLQLGHLTRDDPETGLSAQQLGLRPVDQGVPTATVTGRSADLDTWLWGRPPSLPVESHGDEATLRMLGDLIVAACHQVVGWQLERAATRLVFRPSWPRFGRSGGHHQ